MTPGELKPLLTALVLPPAGPLLVLLVGLLWSIQRRGAGLLLALLALASIWLLSCSAVGQMLAQGLLPPVEAVQPAQLQAVQAIVTLGGGVATETPEYGTAQPGPHSLQRVRYAARLARQTGKPLAFAGGIGWAGGGANESEASVARRMLQDDYGLQLRWADERSRDTRENALRMAEILLPAGISYIALVTGATHMPRAAAHFRAVGFQVLPAPTDFPQDDRRDVLRWLPSAEGLDLSTRVLHEWLGARVAAAPRS